ncbi:MAG: alpha-ribazole transporter [Firmicutes bacterium]|nr:alpha-ribazole transporter [Bacillota bacterium]
MELPRVKARLPRGLADTRNLQLAARTIVFIVLSALGAMVKASSPVGVLTLAAAPSFFVALTYSWAEGAVVAGLGTILAAVVAGFPLGVFAHLYSAVQAALWATCLRLAYEQSGPLIALISTIFLAGVVAAGLLWPLGGLPLVVGSLARLIANAAFNVAAAMALFLLFNRSKVVYVRRRH